MDGATTRQGLRGRLWLVSGALLLVVGTSHSGASLPAAAALVRGRAATYTVRYSYDAAGRLTEADYGADCRITYRYDAAGNLLERVVAVPGVTVAIEPRHTNHTSPRLTGTVSDPAATVLVTVGGHTYPATNHGDGTWSLNRNTIAPALTAGTYAVTVAATDAEGQSASVTEDRGLVIDDEWTMALLVTTGGQPQPLTLGVAEGATDAAVPGEDILSAGAGVDGRFAAFVADGVADLVQDVRGVTPRVAWRLKIVAPAGRAESVLSWAPTQTPEAGGLSLVEVDSAGQMLAAGINLDLARLDPVPITVTAGTTRWFEVLFGECVFRLALDRGWNLVSVPIELGPATADAVLGPDVLLPAWQWDRAQKCYVQAAHIQPGDGFWAYVPGAGGRGAPAAQVLRGRRVEAATVTLPPGWSLVGPAATPPYPAHLLPLNVTPPEAAVGGAWQWQADAYQEATQALDCGRAYWLRLGQAAEVNLAEP